MIFERSSYILWKWILLKQLIIQSLRYIWNYHQFSARGKGVKFSSYDSLTISPIVALFAVRARVVFVCGRGADVDYRKLCKGENQCTQSNELRRERDKGRQRKTQSLREEREKGDSSRNTEREESFPGRCLAPNCMPESDCISSSFSLPFSPSLFHSRSSSLARWVFASFKLSLPPHNSTPLRKRGIRNVIAPLREISCYDPVAIPLLLSLFLLLPLPSATCIRKRRRASILRSGLTFFRYPFNRDANIVEQERKKYTERRRTKVVREGSLFFSF